MEKVFENESFLAVDKPSGWLSVPSRLGNADPRPCLSLHCMEELGAKLWPTHRLDEEVSGLLLFAKNEKAHREANGWFENRALHKAYEAWTEGSPAELRAGHPVEWRSKLLRGKRRAYEHAEGKVSITQATFQKQVEFQGISFLSWRLEPLTGRSHQLRYELSKHGFPILGDELYGSKHAYHPPAIALRSVELDFSGCVTSQQFGLPAKIRIKGL